MDLQQLIAQFFDDKGQIALPEHFTLPRLSETIYQAHLATGGGDALNIRDWDYTCLLYTSPSPRDLSTSRMPSSA